MFLPAARQTATARSGFKMLPRMHFECGVVQSAFSSLKWPAVALKWSNRRSEGRVGKSRARCSRRRSGVRPIIVQRAGAGGEGYQVISGLGRGAWACIMVGLDLEFIENYHGPSLLPPARSVL